MRMENPLVSIGLPTYNRAHLIERALDSLLAQTYSNWECTIVDDGSTDETQQVLARYGDPRFRIVTHESNRGILSARNTGLDNIRGEWFTFLSSDDELVPHAIATMLNVPLNIDATVSQVVCKARDVAAGGHAQTEGWFLVSLDLSRSP